MEICMSAHIVSSNNKNVAWSKKMQMARGVCQFSPTDNNQDVQSPNNWQKMSVCDAVSK